MYLINECKSSVRVKERECSSVHCRVRARNNVCVFLCSDTVVPDVCAHTCDMDKGQAYKVQSLRMCGYVEANVCVIRVIPVPS